VTLGILYHMPFWQAADGSLWEAEGSFARYVDSLAPYFDEVLLSVPVFDTPPASGSRLRAANVRLVPLPYFPGPRQFYPRLPAIIRRLRAWVEQCDVVHLRVPSPAAIFAFRLAQARRKPVFLLVVGDYRALLPHLPYRGLRRALFTAYVAFEEWALGHMVRRALTFVNGAALREKHARDGTRVHETKTTTLAASDIGSRADTCASPRARMLTVSRIDPRKGLRVLPRVVAALVADGHDVTLDVVGPAIGRIGDVERDAILHEAATLGVGDRVTFVGPLALDELLPRYRDYDLFVLPTRPGEGIPRVLMEAMAGGLPVVTTRVAGIGSLITHGDNGLLVDEASPEKVAEAARAVLTTPALRRRLIEGGYATARAHTLERQAAVMMTVVAGDRRVTLRAPARAGAAGDEERLGSGSAIGASRD
jgi:phosphatidyl-myo-inositol dimannoside synthase